MNIIAVAFPLIFLIIISSISYYQIKNYNNELPVRFKSYGNPAHETIIFIPGLDGVTAFFNDIVPELTCYYHVVVYNLPLIARDGDKTKYTFDFIAADLMSVVDELRVEDVTMFGESFGGIIAQHFAHKYPNKLEKLVLMSSLAKTDLPPEIQWKLDNLMPVIETFGYYFPHFAQMLFAQIHVDDVVEPSESNAVRQLFLKEASFAHFYSVLARIKLASRLDILHLLPTIRTPTLVIYGDDDHFTKKDSLQLHQLLSHSELKSLPGGHLAHVGSPKELARLLLAEKVTDA